MGSSRVKKPKQVTSKQFDLFINLVNTKFGKVSDDIGQLKLQAIQDLSLIAESMEVWNKRMSAVESNVNKNEAAYEIGKMSQNMLNNLKQQTAPSPFIPKVSQWKTDEERCQHTLRALKNAFRLMRGIRLESGDTIIVAHVLCQNRYRLINLSITKNEITLGYYRRSGKYIVESYENTTQAAAAMTAVCMFYATR